MSDTETLFTNEVNRNVLQLSLSVSKPEEDAPMVNGNSNHDHRMTNGFDSEEDEAPKEPEKLDIDLFRSTWASSSTNSNGGHTFCRVDTLRGLPSHPTSHGENQRPSPYAAVIQTYDSSLLAPRLSSFPAIFDFSGHSNDHGVAVKAALSASTIVADRMRFLASVVGRSVGVEEREELKADLLKRAEEYVEGWESGGDSDED